MLKRLLMNGFVIVGLIWVAGCTLATTQLGESEATVAGRVTFADGHPALRVSVSLGETIATLNARGEYDFTPVPFGEHTINVTIGDKLVYSETVIVSREQVAHDIVLDRVQPVSAENLSFERMDIDGTLPGWSISFSGSYTPRGNEVTQSTEHVTDGTYSLRVEDPSNATLVRVKGDTFDAQAGDLIIATVDNYRESSPAELWIEFWNSENTNTNNNRIDYRQLRHSGTQTSSTIVGDMVAPEGTVAATITLYSNIANTGVVYYDNVRVWSVR